MVKRIVDTKFWTSMDVLDQYSVEDKFFALYLMTNPKSSQVGIYSLPKKIISFETGFTREVIDVLLNRFTHDYEQIAYSNQTQEITLLKSLEFSILRGGKPVSDLLERELSTIQDGQLILMTYEKMQHFWEISKRPFDKTIESIFEEELLSRELINLEKATQNHNQNQKHNDNQNHTHNDNQNHTHNDNQNHNHNQESYSTNRSPEENLNRGANRRLLINTDRLLPEEQVHLTKYLEFLKYQQPSFDQAVRTDEILYVFYEELVGELSSTIREKIKSWDKQLPKSLILEAMVRSIDKYNPAAYIQTIIDNWLDQNVTNLREVARLDREFNRNQ